MKIVQINATCTAGSTGKICLSVSRLLAEKKVENYILHTQGDCAEPSGVSYTSTSYVKLQALKSRIMGNYGFNSRSATKHLITLLDQIKPDMVHLHNLHGHNCHLGMLLSYFKNKGIKLYWTFHDCWAFTGYCPHFDMFECNKWESGCDACPQYKYFSWFFDRSQYLFYKKKQLLDGLDLTIITPSQWLADLVKRSFLKEYSVKVINNGIDLAVFHPTESQFRKTCGCENKKILLGVAFGWDERKGLDVFIELSKRLNDTYQIVLVGTNDQLDKCLPKNIISIHRTANQEQLAEIYSEADLFINPTREETYPTVNMESLACGTPVLTFKTGGSPEILDDTCGAVVEKNDIDALENMVYYICEHKPFGLDDCLKRAKNFNRYDKYQEYLKLYGVE